MSETQTINLPATALARLDLVSKAYKTPVDELIKQVYEVYNSEFIQKDTTLITPEDRLEYCSKVVKAQYITRPPLTEIDVIIYGLGRVFNTKAGNRQGEVYVILQEKDVKNNTSQTVRRRIVFQGRNTDKIPDIQTCCAYHVKLGKFQSGDLIADDRSRFENPIKLDGSPIQLLESQGIHRCTIAESVNNLAKMEKTSTGTYMDRGDWRIIRGMIGNYNKGQSKEGQEWGVYTITDDSLEEDLITPDGSKLVKQAFTVWVNPLWVTFEKGNEVDFCGPISVNPKEKEPRQVSMTAFLLVPVRTPMGGIKE